MLVLFVARYTVHLRDDHDGGARETVRERRERVLRSQAGLTLTCVFFFFFFFFRFWGGGGADGVCRPTGVPLVFRRR